MFSFILVSAAVALLVRYFFSIKHYPEAPGPSAAKWTGLWYVYEVYKGHFEQQNIAQHARYGKVIRVAPNKYSIDDPEASRLIYGINSPLIKTNWYSSAADPMVGPNDNVFSVQDRGLHSAMRRKQAPLYSMSNIKQYEPYVDECVQALVSQFDRLAESGEAIDLQFWSQCYAFDAISQMTYGTKYGFIEAGFDKEGIMASLFTSQSFTTMMGLTLPWGIPFCLFNYGFALMKMLGFVKNLNKKAEKAHETREMDETEKTTNNPTFFEKVEKIRLDSPVESEKYRVKVALQQNIMAGSDTTSIALTAVLYNCLKNDKVWAKLRMELKGYDHTFEQAQKMPYLQRVIKEALRMHSSVGLPMWRLIPTGGMDISGVQFPEGTWVGVNPWVAHRNDHVFEKADLFDPDRWDPEVTPKERLDLMESYWLAFGAGSRTCLGRHISMMEMLKLVPELINRYDMELVDSGKPLESKNNWFVKQVDVLVRLKRV